ncbi:MAG: hypothetical protein K2I67_00170, partial [Malacoplasma sp.]|nr:hypothetical protein [Malacoplasma sp.]
MEELSAGSVVSIFSVFFVILIICAFLKKLWFLVVHKKRYYIFPRPSIKGISNISMVIALSVAVLILITMITQNVAGILFRAFPGSRITIEGILIKIGGLLFGTFIGMIIGILTDLLSIALTAGIFHYGYFISAMAYGLLSGLVKTLIANTSSKKIVLAWSSTTFLFVVYGVAILFIYSVIPDANAEIYIQLVRNVVVNRDIIFGVITFFIFVSIITIWFFYKVSTTKKNKENKKTKLGNKFNAHYDKKESVDNSKLFSSFCPTIVCVLSTELLINVLMMPSFDADLSTLTYMDWFLIRLLIFIPMIFVNMVIIFPVYIIVSPLVTWDYRKEMYEDLK